MTISEYAERKHIREASLEGYRPAEVETISLFKARRLLARIKRACLQ